MAARKGVTALKVTAGMHTSTLNKQRYPQSAAAPLTSSGTTVILPQQAAAPFSTNMTAYQGDATIKELLQQRKQHKPSTDQDCSSILALRPQAQEVTESIHKIGRSKITGLQQQAEAARNLHATTIGCDNMLWREGRVYYIVKG
jgi:hypothetical protein